MASWGTDWRGASSVRADELPVYDALREERARLLGNVRAERDPEATGPAILEVVDAEEPPLRVFFGDGPLDMIRDEYARRIATWEQWNELSVSAE